MFRETPKVPSRRRQPTLVLLPGKSHGRRSLVGCSPWGRCCVWLHFHAKEMATHSNVLAWRIPGMGEPGGLPSMRSHRVRHDWSDLAAAAAAARCPLNEVWVTLPLKEPTFAECVSISRSNNFRLGLPTWPLATWKEWIVHGNGLENDFS